MVVTSRHLWVILCPTSYEFLSQFLNLHQLFFCHLDKCQQPVSVGFVRDEACSCAVTFQASLNAKMSLTSPSRQTDCGCFARSGNLSSYCGKCWLHHNVNITHYCIEISVPTGRCRENCFYVAGVGLCCSAVYEALKQVFFFIKPLFFLEGWIIRCDISVWHIWGLESSSFQSVIVALSLCCQHSNILDV